ncbi:MAG TPA: squalene synthase HpnC [Candidatus Acidoferrales bacterium]|jgi:squalene synthase HpnC/squalene synthase HpnD|nr:squalene synthase HpnC [Candidatus Acidoferrales bacterium]
MLPTPELEIARNLPAQGCTAEDAQRYTRWLATHHYENFSVVSWLLPRHLHQHFYNLYAYCRWADDLGDEVPDRARAMQLLDAWEEELRSSYEPGQMPSHPVLIALRETIRAKDIPVGPFSDLLRAFRQDQVVRRYATWDDVLGYCVYSANPVGRLVLYLCGYRDAERQRLSDFTCTALQLANFWQDVSRDLEKGRIYIPLDALAAHGLTEADITGRRFDERYVALMKSLIARTRELFAAGMPLAERLEGALRVDIEMFSRGGLAVLDAIEHSGYNTLDRRPSISKFKQVGLLSGALVRRAFTGVETGSRAQSAAGTSTTGESARIEPGVHTARLPGDSDVVRASYAECNRIARASRSSFYLAFFGLPRPKRDALCALYAFMRLVDDVSDEAGDIDSKRRGLAQWRAKLDEAAGGNTSGHPVLPALADTIARFEIPTRYFHDLISGAEMDLTVASYATFDRLSEYCYRVAGTVGLTCLYVFGFRDPRSPDLAERLGLAFQLTNIIRDIHADFEMGRVYLPDDDIQRFGCASGDLRGPLTAGLRDLLAFEAERAWRLYEEGAPLVDQVDADSRATLAALIRTYSTLLARIEERGFDVFSSRVSLSSTEKVQYLVTARIGWKRDVLAKRSGDRRRSGGPGLRRRAG